MSEAKPLGYRNAVQIERLVGEMTGEIRRLERTIAEEERRTGVTDVGNFAYSMLASSARARRDNLMRSADQLRRETKALAA